MKEGSFQRKDLNYNAFPWKNEARDTVSYYPYRPSFRNTSIPPTPFSTAQHDTHTSQMARSNVSTQSTLMPTINKANEVIRRSSYYDQMSGQTEASPLFPPLFSSPLPADPYY